MFCTEGGKIPLSFVSPGNTPILLHLCSCLCSQVRPGSTREDKLMSLVFIASSSSLYPLICDYICAIRAMGSRKGLSLSGSGSKLGGMCVGSHLHVLTRVLRQKHLYITGKDLWPERFGFSLGFAFLLIIYLFKPGYVRTMRGYVKMRLSVDLRWVTEVLEFAILTPWLYNKAEVSPIPALSAPRKSGF